MERSQHYESAELSPEERRKSNDALGPVPWCLADDATTASLRRVLDRHYRTRRLALESLAGLLSTRAQGEKGDTINLDFVNRFSDYFYVDDPCLCDVIPSRGRVLGAGSVGSVSSVTLGVVPLVLKCINNVAFQKYLSLRVSPFGPDVRDQVRHMNGSNETNLFHNDAAKGDKHVHLHVNGDSFSNQTCMHLILNLLLGDNPHYVYQFDSFYCSSKSGSVTGCNIMESADLGDLSSFLEKQGRVGSDLVTDILGQLLPTLFSLKTPDLGFVHADLKCRNVFVARARAGGQDYKLADYDKSSIYFRGVRFHNSSPLTAGLPYNSFPVSVIDGVEYYRLSSTATYVASFAANPGGYIQLQTMYNPYGFYMSYDVYTFLFSLLMEPSVWPYFREMGRGTRVQDQNWLGWRALWFDDDFDSVMAYIRSEQVRYDTLTNDDAAAAEQLRKMRSLRNMNDAFALNGWKFKTNVMESYVHFTGSNRVPSVNTEAYKALPLQRELVISNGQHVCVNHCDSGWCNTNRYKKRGYTGTAYVYDWDYC